MRQQIDYAPGSTSTEETNLFGRGLTMRQFLTTLIAFFSRSNPGADILTAPIVQEAFQQVEQTIPDLVIVDLVMPEATGQTAQANLGLQLLKTLIEHYPKLNIVVQSAHVRPLVWLKPTIDNHHRLCFIH